MYKCATQGCKIELRLLVTLKIIQAYLINKFRYAKIDNA